MRVEGHDALRRHHPGVGRDRRRAARAPRQRASAGTRGSEHEDSHRRRPAQRPARAPHDARHARTTSRSSRPRAWRRRWRPSRRAPPDLLLLDIRLSPDARDRGGPRAAPQAARRRLGRARGHGDVARRARRDPRGDALRRAGLRAQGRAVSRRCCCRSSKSFRERLALRGEVDAAARAGRAILGLSRHRRLARARWRPVRRLVRRVADANATVLIRGETGTGKELVARALHEMSAPAQRALRGRQLLRACPARSSSRSIFGHERGAFTGAERRTRGQLELAGAGHDPARRDRRDADRAPGQAPPRPGGPALPSARRRRRAPAPGAHRRVDARRPASAGSPRAASAKTSTTASTW